MFTLDYRLDPIATARMDEMDLAATDSGALRYRLFPGDIVVRDEGVDFSTRWGWVQILDFALGLKAIDEMFAKKHDARFEFTESSASLDFRLDDDSVCISSNYAPGLLRVRVSVFREEVRRFVQRVIGDLCKQYPSLAKNPVVTEAPQTSGR